LSQHNFANYREFFAFYLAEHNEPHNRILHVLGTVLGLAVVVGAFIFHHPVYALAWPIVAYGFAWTGHFLVEGNRPATFGHPFWSFMGDFHMVFLMMTGRLQSRLPQGSRSATGD
jgi:hypothetical protein